MYAGSFLYNTVLVSPARHRSAALLSPIWLKSCIVDLISRHPEYGSLSVRCDRAPQIHASNITTKYCIRVSGVLEGASLPSQRFEARPPGWTQVLCLSTKCGAIMFDVDQSHFVRAHRSKTIHTISMHISMRICILSLPTELV